MKQDKEKLSALLLKSFDQELTEDEKLLLEKGLNHFEELRQEQESIKNMRSLLASSESQFSNGFKERVMDSVYNAEVQNKTLMRILKSVIISGVAAVVALLLSIYFIDGSLSTDSLLGIANYSPSEAEFSFFGTNELN